MMSSDSDTAYISDSSTIRQISRGIRFTVSLFSIAAGLYCGRAVWLAPKFQQIYEDILSMAHLRPSALDFLIQHHLGFIIASAALSILPAFLAYRVRLIFRVIVIGAISILLQIALGVWASAALMSPMQQIIQVLAN